VRVALVPSAYHPAVGGVELLTARLASALGTAGDEVEVWTFGSPALPAEEVMDGVTVRRFDFPMPSSRPDAVPRLLSSSARTGIRLRRAMQLFEPDVVHVQCFSGNGVWALAAARLAGVPLVVTLQGETVMDDAKIYQESTSLRAGLRLAMRHAAVVTGCSEFALNHASSLLGAQRQDARVVFNGVDLVSGPEVGVGVPFDRYVVAVGRAVHNKGFDLLIDAFHLVAPVDPDIGLVVGGAGPALDDLRRQAADLGLDDRVHFTGGLEPGQVRSLMSDASVVIVPSRVEPFGIVALEAWRSGTPLVVTDRGGPPEFVTDEVDGLLVDPFDRTRLAGAILRVLESADLAAGLVAGGRDRLPDFAWTVIAGRYKELYSQALRVRRERWGRPW
jgi:glycogen(starch) synthase